jgi:hypothetical protein
LIYKVSLIAGLLYFSAFLGILNTLQTANNITIQIIDGRIGKPLMNQHIIVFGGATEEAAQAHQIHYEFTTDDKGLATLSPDKSANWIQVWVDWHILCQSKELQRTFSRAEISTPGLNSINACSSFSLNKIPGRLIIYVRPEHFWEKMKH